MAARRVAVIGAGLGGLAAAVRLASKGHEVRLFERRAIPGGKASTLDVGGYRFDTGPSLFTMRPVFDELFETAGERLDDHLELVPLDPICTYYYPDGRSLLAWADPERLAAEIGERTDDDPGAVRAHLDHSRKIYESAGELFLRNSLSTPSTFLKPEVIRALLRPWRIDGLRTMNAAHRSRFRDPHTIQLFDRYATYNGSDPFRAPATLDIISYVEHCLGCYAVRGGIYRIVEAIAGIAVRLGVEIRYGAPVEQIVVRGGRVRGVVAAGREEAFDAVVSDVDAPVLHALLSGEAGRRAARRPRAEPSSSAVVFLWGMEQPLLGLETHSVFFSRDYRREFRDIFERGLPPEDPTVYLYLSSRLSPADAPPGGEGWFLLVNAPPNRGQEWPRHIARLRRAVLERLERSLGRPIAPAIRCERVLTPADLEESTGSRYGSLYGAASNGPLAAFRRQPNRVRGVGGLYACGGSTHPGGGMPLVLLSAKIATDLLERDER